MEFPLSESTGAISGEIPELQLEVSSNGASIPSADTDIRLHGLGLFHVFPDIFLAKYFLIPFWFEGTKHIPTFLLLSKAWYQFANHEAVWRKIALLMCKGDCFYEHSWKYTTQLVLLKRKSDYLAMNFIKFESSSSEEETLPMSRALLGSAAKGEAEGVTTQASSTRGKERARRGKVAAQRKNDERGEGDLEDDEYEGDDGGEDAREEQSGYGRGQGSYYHAYETSSPTYRADTSSSDLQSNSTRSSSSSSDGEKSSSTEASDSGWSTSDEQPAGGLAFPGASKKASKRAFRLGPYPDSTNWNAYPTAHAFGFPSYYFQFKWTLASYDMSQLPPVYSSVPRLTLVREEDFMINYAIPGRICLLTDIVPKWPAFERWDPDRLASRFPHGVIDVATANLMRQRIRMTWAQYITYMRRQRDSSPLYVFDAEIGDKYPGLLKDFEIPEYFWQDYFSLLGERFRPPYRWFVMGPKGSGSGWHIDPNGTAAWNALVRGTKRWAFYPPDTIPPGLKRVVFDRRGKVKHAVSPNPLTWYLSTMPHLQPHQKPFELLQHAGEMLYIPSGWWHMVLNIDETVSVTQNFVNKVNLNLSCVIMHNKLEKGFIKFWLSRLKQIDPWAYKTAHSKFQSLQRTNSSRRAVYLEEENAQLQERVAELEALLAEQREKERAKDRKEGRKGKQNALAARRAARK